MQANAKLFEKGDRLSDMNKRHPHRTHVYDRINVSRLLIVSV